MIKKTLFSVIFVSSVSLAIAQDIATEGKSSQVEKGTSSASKNVVLTPIRVSEQSSTTKNGSTTKSAQPAGKPTQAPVMAKPMQVRVVGKSTPVKEKSNNKK